MKNDAQEEDVRFNQFNANHKFLKARKNLVKETTRPQRVSKRATNERTKSGRGGKQNRMVGLERFPSLTRLLHARRARLTPAV